jgi:Molybdopterin guanine dinucleotide synthesis protein B
VTITTHKVFGVVGWKNSGKTTLVGALVRELPARGYRVSTIKYAHHAFDIDVPGKDSYRHREAGAAEVLAASGQRWALMHELSAPRQNRYRHDLWPHLLQTAQDQSQHRLRRPKCRHQANRRPHLARQLHALRSGILRRRNLQARTPSMPFRAQSVTYVSGITCYPCVRYGPGDTGGGLGTGFEHSLALLCQGFRGYPRGRRNSASTKSGLQGRQAGER